MSSPLALESIVKMRAHSRVTARHGHSHGDASPTYPTAPLRNSGMDLAPCPFQERRALIRHRLCHTLQHVGKLPKTMSFHTASPTGCRLKRAAFIPDLQFSTFTTGGQLHVEPTNMKINSLIYFSVKILARPRVGDFGLNGRSAWLWHGCHSRLEMISVECFC